MAFWGRGRGFSMLRVTSSGIRVHGPLDFRCSTAYSSGPLVAAKLRAAICVSHQHSKALSR